MREVGDSGRAEIAAHLHPWNTPPLTEAFVPRNSMLNNLPAELQLTKLQRLTAAAALVRCGYRVDSSVTPFVNWEDVDDGPTFFGAPLSVYRLSPSRDVRHPDPDGDLLEIPLSSGFCRGPVRLWDPARRFLDAAPLRQVRLAGQAALTGLLKRTVLSPELASVNEMLALSSRLLEQGVRHLQLSWHSPSLKPGLSPYTATAADVARLYASVEAYLEGLSKITSLTFATISEAAALLG